MTNFDRSYISGMLWLIVANVDTSWFRLVAYIICIVTMAIATYFAIHMDDEEKP